jgi:hypothetical protein
MLVIEGAIITIDAMACQCAIARKIIEKKADYVFGLKGNQGSPRDDAELLITEQKARDFVDSEISQATTIDSLPLRRRGSIMAGPKPEPPPSSTTSSGCENAMTGPA